MRDDLDKRGGHGLFEVEPVEKSGFRAARSAAVDTTLRTFDPHQVLLLHPSPDD
ncbi:hypothetical protein AB0O20_33170 [Streptomyces kronopolitis]|uniref:hypothetical protein n=1 Tax=Streptomyces kronopolitis TaxID=1612435 RepID=UPI0034481455